MTIGLEIQKPITAGVIDEANGFDSHTPFSFDVGDTTQPTDAKFQLCMVTRCLQ